MSISNNILQNLFEQTIYYKGVPVNIFGIPKFNHISKKTLSQNIYRLSQKGYIEKNSSGYVLTNSGKKYITKQHTKLKRFEKSKSIPKEKTLLVFFDIPESKKTYRTWFRDHLKSFDFIMVQKSVWVGPNPLPNEFSDYIKEINLSDCIQTFQLAKPYISPKDKKKGVRSYLDKIKSMI
jgi:DNA-binding transcriptional regulator PaaX